MKEIPLGLPGQKSGMPTTTSERGDDTQERFRYQWAVGVMLLIDCLSEKIPCSSLWCEHHDDYLIELNTGAFISVQVKSDSSANAEISVSTDAFGAALVRFCALEAKFPDGIVEYWFCSNAKPYVPAETAKETKVVRSPVRLVHFCVSCASHAGIEEPYKSAFEKLCEKLLCNKAVLFAVLRKLRFRQTPSLNDYDSVIADRGITAVPGCGGLSVVQVRQLRDALISLVQNACRTNQDGKDGVISFIAANGQAEASIRAKCITRAGAQALVDSLKYSAFRFADIGLALQSGISQGRLGTLEKKMRVAYLGSQYEGLKWRAVSADQSLLERAALEPEGFDESVNELTAKVLLACKDAEALAVHVPDEKLRGAVVYADVLKRLEKIADNDVALGNSLDLLMGVAGMLSGECRFAWGVALETVSGP